MPKSFIKLKSLNLKQSKKPRVRIANSITIYDGRTFSGNQIRPNSNNGKEIENAIWLCNTFKIDVYIMPEIKYKGIKSYDYLLDGSKERWDLKANISGNSKRLFKK